MADFTPQNKKIVPAELGVHLPDHLREGKYANLVNFSASHNEVVINFISVNTGDTPPGTLVSRVIVTREVAREISKTLNNLLSTADEVDPK